MASPRSRHLQLLYPKIGPEKLIPLNELYNQPTVGQFISSKEFIWYTIEVITSEELAEIGISKPLSNILDPGDVFEGGAWKCN